MLILLGAVALFSGSALADEADSSGPVNVIFDTDVCLDVDDGMALAIVHALHDRHEANLIAVTVGLDEGECAPYVSALNYFYGHPDVPIGTLRNGLNRNVIRENIRKLKELQPRRGRETYADLILKQMNTDGSPLYPRRLANASQAPEAVFLLRKTLADEPDDSVVMIQVGNSANFAALLGSRPDTLSELSGLELIEKKVRFLSVMAGTFDNAGSLGGGAGVNVYDDVRSAQKLFDQWPTPVVASGAEIGAAITFPGISIERDFSYVPHHPISESYRHSCTTFLKSNYPEWVKKCPHDHHTLDLTAALYALRPDRDYFSLSKAGRITVLSSGNVRFDEDKNGRHRYLIVNEEQKVRAQEAMMMLVSQPPLGMNH